MQNDFDSDEQFARDERAKAEQLLTIHNGACFIVAGNHLEQPFRDMAAEGLVTLEQMVSPTRGMTIRRKGYSPKRFARLPSEGQSH